MERGTLTQHTRATLAGTPAPRLLDRRRRLLLLLLIVGILVEVVFLTPVQPAPMAAHQPPHRMRRRPPRPTAVHPPSLPSPT
eukprot:COSAG01_NODE_28602_length_657_cov_1.023297_2_plen_81_part_01